MLGRVVAVARDGVHRFSKAGVPEIRLVEGQGVEGDAHAGETVRHRSRVAVDPTRPNLRQVHLIQRELFEELAAQGLSVAAGEMGENITTAGLDLLALPEGTRLRIGPQAEVVVTGLRNPCGQIEAFRPGLLAAVLGRDAGGQVVRKAGIMAVVARGGLVRPGDGITVRLPPAPHRPLVPV
jgi:MOSC domain-containing protein YiiM